jgi:hypothetical protein
MSTEEKVLQVGSLLAAADLSTKNHYLVKVSAANAVNLAGVGDTAIGVLANKPASGEPALVSVGVIAPVVAGEAISAGADIAPDATGRARTALTDDHICGIALEASSAAAEEIRCLMLPQTASLDADGHVVEVGVAATKSTTANQMVCLDADGYLVDAADATAVSFWGVALDTVDNSTGADGDLDCSVRRWGIAELTGAGLAATDVGKECWVSTDSATITTTPGDILVGVIDSIASATEPTVRYRPMPIVGERTDRQFEIPFVYNGAVGAVGVKAHEDREYPTKYKVLQGYADAETAPGGAYVCTIELDDGTTQFAITITGSATHGENKTAGATSFLAATDTDVTLVDDDASGATEFVKGVFLCEAL